ncbi:MAG: glycosyltransferase family 2 protein [Patescibacteria group bacterium]
MKKITVSIIILNWNGIENTKKCLDSLLIIHDVAYEVIVIDNGSRVDEAAELKKIYTTKITVYRQTENTGFTGGCNLGITQAKKNNPDFYLLLNNDTQVTPPFLKELIQTARSNKKIGIVSPVIYDSKRENILFSGGSINWFLGKTFHKKEYLIKVKANEFITGCCFLIKKQVIESIGLLDKQFFAYFEDAAYCISARKAGYYCVCAPRAIIFHQQTASSDKRGPFNTYLMARNRILFVNNYAPKVIKYYFFFFNALKLIIAFSFFLITRQQERAYAYYKGYLDGTLGRGGVPRI